MSYIGLSIKTGQRVTLTHQGRMRDAQRRKLGVNSSIKMRQSPIKVGLQVDLKPIGIAVIAVI